MPVKEYVVKISQSTDDASELETGGTVTTNGVGLVIGYFSQNYISGYRFLNVEPPGTLIDVKLRVYGSKTIASGAGFNSEISPASKNNPATFDKAIKKGITGRDYIKTSVEWNDYDEGLLYDQYFYSPDIKALWDAQIAIDGADPPYDVQYMIKGVGGVGLATINLTSYDGDATNAPALVFRYYDEVDADIVVETDSILSIDVEEGASLHVTVDDENLLSLDVDDGSRLQITTHDETHGAIEVN